MKEEFSLDVDENTINELKKAIGYDEIEARHKRFMEGKETADDLINHIYHYKIKNDKGLDLDVVELKYYNKIIDLYNKEKEKNKNAIDFINERKKTVNKDMAEGTRLQVGTFMWQVDDLLEILEE